MLKAHNSIAHGVAMVRRIQHALPPPQVLLVEDVRQRAGNDCQRKAGNAREQDGCLVQALVQKVVQNSACMCRILWDLQGMECIKGSMMLPGRAASAEQDAQTADVQETAPMLLFLCKVRQSSRGGDRAFAHPKQHALMVLPAANS